MGDIANGVANTLLPGKKNIQKKISRPQPECHLPNSPWPVIIYPVPGGFGKKIQELCTFFLQFMILKRILKGISSHRRFVIFIDVSLRIFCD